MEESDGGKVTAARTRTHQRSTRQTHLRGVGGWVGGWGWSLCRVHTLQIAANMRVGAHTSMLANRRRCQNRPPPPNARHLRTSCEMIKQEVSVCWRINGHAAIFLHYSCVKWTPPPLHPGVTYVFLPLPLTLQPGSCTDANHGDNLV